MTTWPSIRTGRANPGMFSRINIDYYGSMTPITQLSSINVPEARMIVIKPYEASQLGAIETSIRNSDLGVNPTNDGNIIRVSIPQLTEERRRELVKQAKSKGEDAKVSVRNIRRKAMEELSRIKKDGESLPSSNSMSSPSICPSAQIGMRDAPRILHATMGTLQKSYVLAYRTSTFNPGRDGTQAGSSHR